MAGSLIAFLIFNHNPAKIFMGDSGSLILGLVNAILVIKFINVAHSPFVAIPLTSSVAIGFSILIVPLLDTLRVFSIRIMNGKSPFTPDRNHLHHLLLDRGLGHKAVTICCVGINIGFILIAWVGRSLGSTLLLTTMISLAFIGIAFLYYYRRPRRTMIITKSATGKAELKTTTKILTLTKEVQTAEQN